MPRGEKPFYSSKPPLKQNMMLTTRASSRLAKAPKLEKELSAVPMASMLKDTLATVEDGAKVAALDAVQTTAVVPDTAPKMASAPKEPEDGLLSKVGSAPLSVAIGKGNIEMSSSSDDDSSSSDSEDSDSGSGSSSDASSSSHVGKPVKPSFPVGVGTAVVSTAELVDAVSAASVATAKLIGPELPSSSLFEGSPEEALPETYGPGKPDKADDETMDEGIMDVANDIFEEEQEDDIDEEEKEDVDGEEEQEEDGAEVEDATMEIQAFRITSLVGHG